MKSTIKLITVLLILALTLPAVAAVPANALKERWGEIEYACFADRQGYLTLARRVPGETGWEEKRSKLRVAMRNVQMAIDGNGRIHIVCGADGAPLRYVFSVEQGGLELGPASPMIGSQERMVMGASLAAMDDGSLLYIYNSGTRTTPRITINWFSLYDGVWTRLHDSLFDSAKLKGGSWKAETERSGTVRLCWNGAGPGKTGSGEVVSRDGGLTWESAEGEELDLPIR